MQNTVGLTIDKFFMLFNLQYDNELTLFSETFLIL